MGQGIVSAAMFLWTNYNDYNTLVLGKYGSDFRSVILQHMLWIKFMKQQGITWDNVDPDLCHYAASLGHNMLKPEICLKH